ncbi:MAG: hypothetical protein IKL84_06470, partial [Clostridia bacterium]|nr:hypothetical protein [Clostridia bacterium]
TAVPTDTGRFVCWTVGAPLSGGGTPFSTTEECSFYLSMDTTIYANFANKESATLIYDANGGQTKDGGRYLRHDSPTDFYFYPHALANQGQLTRDGYVLYAYNTEPDGSGTQYTFGANVVTPANGTLMLYAQWLRADPAQFEYQVAGEEVYIKGCKSTDEWVVVPETIEGKPVTTLKTRALKGLTNMTTLVLNPKIKWVDDAAVYDCPNFTTLYLCDNVKRIPDGFYVKCPEFQTLHLGAVLAPSRMDQRGGTFHIKFQRLLKAKAEGLDAVIVISGSSSEYGLNSEVLEKELNYEYYPVNLGTTVQISVLYLLEAFRDFVDEGDIIIQAPETTSQSQLGGNAFISNYWNCYEGVPELLSHVDLRGYTKLFSTLTQFNENRAKMFPTSYSEHNEAINRYGDNQTVRINPSPDYASSKNRNLSPSNLSETNAARLNEAYANLEATGAKVYFSLAPLNVNSFSEKAKTDAVQNTYQKRFETLLKIPVISHFSDYVMEGRYFFNSDYHPTNEGAVLRTQQLVKDLKAQLAKEAAQNP